MTACYRDGLQQLRAACYPRRRQQQCTKVTVMQSGNKIYETTVPPGAFEMLTLTPQVMVTSAGHHVEEADGSKRGFYRSLFVSHPNVARPGAGISSAS